MNNVLHKKSFEKCLTKTLTADALLNITSLKFGMKGTERMGHFVNKLFYNLKSFLKKLILPNKTEYSVKIQRESEHQTRWYSDLRRKCGIHMW